MLGIFVLVVILSLSGVFGNLGGLLHKIGFPLWKAQDASKAALSNSIYAVRTKSSVFRENKELKTRNEELAVRVLDYGLLQKENEDLKYLFGRITNKEEFTLATIISKPNRSMYDTIVIDIGTDLDIIEGNTVFANAEFPIGKITKVYDKTALVTLFSSSKEVTEAQIEGSNTSVELVGRGGGNFEMNVPHELSVPPGTFVVAPQIGSRIVAIVADVVSDPHDPINKILLKSPVNIQELKWVQVLK